MHGPVPQASPPQPQVSHSITSAGTPSVARSAASLWQLHLEYGVESTALHSLLLDTRTPWDLGPRECVYPASGASRQRAQAAELPQTRDTLFWTFSTLLAHILAQHAVYACAPPGPACALRLRARPPRPGGGAREKTCSKLTRTVHAFVRERGATRVGSLGPSPNAIHTASPLRRPPFAGLRTHRLAS